MKSEPENTAAKECNCQTSSVADIISVVDDVIKSTGREAEKVIPVLQEVQNRLNYLPSEALKHICNVTEITPGQISGVSTFYSQFRHMPVGKHIIKICAGTACHVKGAPLISDAFKRVLKITDLKNSSSDNLFSIEEVACLGCCTLAPVVQIDGKTYGHVKPSQTEEIIADFLASGTKGDQSPETEAPETSLAEVRIGLGSCCVAGGSREILSRLLEIREGYDLNITLKAVGCVGVCNQTPLLEIVTTGNVSSRYTNVRKEQVEEILLKHVKPLSFNKKLRYKLNDLADSFVSDEKVGSPVNLTGEVREKYLNNFLKSQIRLATLNSGIISPVSIDEYILLGGFAAFKKCLASYVGAEIRKIITDSGLRGRGGAGFLTGRKWEIFAGSQDSVKYVVCNGDEGDPGAFMDRMLLESFPFRIIEGMLIAGLATRAVEGIFYIRAEYPLAVTRIRNALKLCYENGILGTNILGSGFSFDLNIFEGAGAFVCGEETALIAS
ncbi:MAG: NAD(P)H-dependent oxidoreductase subunit E, partial [Bacteroidales bacterium]